MVDTVNYPNMSGETIRTEMSIMSFAPDYNQ